MPRLTEESISDLLLTIYEAAAAPALWSQSVSRFSDMLGASSAHLMVVDQATGHDSLGFALGQDPVVHGEYLRDFFAQDIRVPRMARAQIGRVTRGDAFWSGDEKRNSPVYQEYQRVHKLHEITGAQIGIEGHATWLGFARETEDPFSEDEVRAMAAVLPHVRQALKLALMLRSHQGVTDLLGSLWSAKGHALVLVDAAGKVRFANNLAETWGRRGIVHLGRDRLAFGDAHANRLLARHLKLLRPDGSIPGAPEGATLVTAPDGSQIGVRFLPAFPGEYGVPTPCIMVVLVPLADERPAHGPEIGQFARLFQLTASEEKLLAAFARGEEIRQHARERGISAETVRLHMKHILSKTNCASQKHLLLLLERFCFLHMR